MSRIFLAALAAVVLLVSATAATGGSTRIQGTVAAKFPENKLIRVDSRDKAHILRVPGSQARILLGQRVVLRGTTLRQRGNGSRVLARGVTLAGTVASRAGTNGKATDDEVEIKGTLTSLSPLVVTRGARSVTCTVPSGTTLAKFATGDFVEMTCDLLGGVFVLRVLKDDDVANPPNDDSDDTTDDTTTDDDSTDDDNDNSGPGGGGNSGPGGGDH